MGYPIRAFHGTSTEFGNEYRGTGLGPHFGTQEQANAFAAEPGGHVRPVSLSFNKTLELPDGGWENPWIVMSKLEGAGVLSEDEASALANTNAEQSQMFDELRQKLTDKGYDSIAYQNCMVASEGAGTSYIALKPNETVRPGFGGGPAPTEGAGPEAGESGQVAAAVRRTVDDLRLPALPPVTDAKRLKRILKIVGRVMARDGVPTQDELDALLRELAQDRRGRALLAGRVGPYQPE